MNVSLIDIPCEAEMNSKWQLPKDSTTMVPPVSFIAMQLTKFVEDDYYKIMVILNEENTELIKNCSSVAPDRR